MQAWLKRTLLGIFLAALLVIQFVPGKESPDKDSPRKESPGQDSDVPVDTPHGDSPAPP